MSEKHERLRKARIAANYRHASDAAAALGISGSTYRAHENGQNDFTFDEAQVYGKKFSVDPLWLMAVELKPTPNGTSTPAAQLAFDSTIDRPNARIAGKVTEAGKMIPVYGQAVGGVDGEFIMNGTVLYEVLAPPVLSHISGAYAVEVSGDSMSPRYEDGEVCFVDPKRRVKKGDYVIVQVQLEENGPLHGYVKKFCRHNAVELVLEQFNPPKELRFDARAVRSVHFIALAGVA